MHVTSAPEMSQKVYSYLFANHPGGVLLTTPQGDKLQPHVTYGEYADELGSRVGDAAIDAVAREWLYASSLFHCDISCGTVLKYLGATCIWFLNPQTPCNPRVLRLPPTTFFSASIVPVGYALIGRLVDLPALLIDDCLRVIATGNYEMHWRLVSTPPAKGYLWLMDIRAERNSILDGGLLQCQQNP